jgi:hypothetical protein
MKVCFYLTPTFLNDEIPEGTESITQRLLSLVNLHYPQNNYGDAGEERKIISTLRKEVQTLETTRKACPHNTISYNSL